MALLFDTEVNSLTAMEVIELACCELPSIADAHPNCGKVVTVQRFKPGSPFDAGAVATHRILPEHLAACSPSSAAVLPEADFYIGHNVDFDLQVMKASDKKTICTLALSRYLWPEFASHKLSVMILELLGMNEDTLDLISRSHAAGADVLMTLHLLHKIIEKLGDKVSSFEDLHKASEIARIPVFWTFGKHRGERIDQTPSGYISWMMKQENVDPYLMKALKAAL